MARRKAARRLPDPPQSAEPARYEIPAGAARSGIVREPDSTGPGDPAATVVSATEAARNFSDLVNRASYQGETFVIERGGRALCRLGPLEARRCTGADLSALLSRLPRPAPEFLEAVEEIARDQAPTAGSPWDS